MKLKRFFSLLGTEAPYREKDKYKFWMWRIGIVTAYKVARLK